MIPCSWMLSSCVFQLNSPPPSPHLVFVLNCAVLAKHLLKLLCVLVLQLVLTYMLMCFLVLFFFSGRCVPTLHIPALITSKDRWAAGLCWYWWGEVDWRCTTWGCIRCHRMWIIWWVIRVLPSPCLNWFPCDFFSVLTPFVLRSKAPLLVISTPWGVLFTPFVPLRNNRYTIPN